MVVLSKNFVPANTLLSIVTVLSPLVSPCVPLSTREKYGRETSKGEDRPICRSHMLEVGLLPLAPQ